MSSGAYQQPLGTKMISDLRNALLIHNPNAGGGGNGRRRTLDTARHIFAAGGIHSDLAETTGPGHATEIAAAPPTKAAASSSPAAVTARSMKSSTASPPTKTAIACLSPFSPAAPQTFLPKNWTFPGTFP